ncbi:MAG: imidazole glycerol phosphate synthase subunit HisH [Candidatus Kapabacteria bacterium]|nr:imidazole glycerol phosphate synthase subunit HisH [Candidatus Kapabacteria bacterium]
MTTVHLVDTGVNNLLSICNALEMAGANLEICRSPEELAGAERLVLPGVGAYRDCIGGLINGDFVPILNELVFQKKLPILGICVGMQMMARRSYEGGEYEGLGWFEGDVVKIQPGDSSLRVPQIGWNTTTFRTGEPLAIGLPANPDLYYVHSYYLKCDNADDIAATCDYGIAVTSSVRKANIVATQFHPEKSQDFGLRILENFLRWKP